MWREMWRWRLLWCRMQQLWRRWLLLLLLLLLLLRRGVRGLAVARTPFGHQDVELGGLVVHLKHEFVGREESRVLLLELAPYCGRGRVCVCAYACACISASVPSISSLAIARAYRDL